MLDIINTLLKHYKFYELNIFYIGHLRRIVPFTLYVPILNNAIIYDNLFLGYNVSYVLDQINKYEYFPKPVIYNEQCKCYNIDNSELIEAKYSLVSAAEFILYINNNVKNIEDILIQKYMELI